MQLRQLHSLERAKASNAFLTRSPMPAPLGSMPATFAQEVTSLGGLITTVEARTADQVQGNWSERLSARDAAAAELLDSLRPLRNAARAIARRKKGNGGVSPDFKDIVTLPRTRNIQDLINAGRATVTKLEPYHGLFVTRGLPSDFLTQVSTQVATLEARAEDARQAQAYQVTATNEIGHVLREIDSIIQCLSVTIKKMCKADGTRGAAVYAAWLHVSTASSRKRTKQEPAASTPPAGAPQGSVVRVEEKSVTAPGR